MESLINYYSQGFSLTNKSLGIYITGLIILLLSTSRSIVPNLPLSDVLSFLMTLIDMAFSLSIPVFLLQKQQNKSLSIQNMFSVTIQSIKRMLLPVILLFIVLLILFIVLLILVAFFLHPTKEQIQQFFQSLSDPSKGLTPVLFVPPIMLSFFAYTPILFSLEGKGLLTSIKDSFIFSFRHLPYLFTVMLVGTISYSAVSFLPSIEVWGLVLRLAISLYVSLMITATTLFYYQKTIQDKDS